MKIIYGPIASWRLGVSLGIDLICKRVKKCTFNCIYCQLKKSEAETQRMSFVSLSNLKEELMKALQVEPDVITFSGMGEPTLAKNLNSAIEIVRKCTDIPLAILTNSSLMYNKEVREELKKLDIIVAKLDAANEDYFRKINQPGKGITFKKTLEGIKKMREGFKGKFALQTMFVQENALIAKEIAEIAREIDPNEIHINTPLRPCRVKPLPKKQLFEIEGLFKGLKTLNVYKCKKPNTLPLDMQELLERGRPVP